MEVKNQQELSRHIKKLLVAVLLIHWFVKYVNLEKSKVIHNGSKTTDPDWGKNKSR